jgi:hypothetical protein
MIDQARNIRPTCDEHCSNFAQLKALGVRVPQER